jgi:cobalt-zinc-cadmium efflux system outer membrane protein
MFRSIIAVAALVLLRFGAASAQQPPELSLREVYDLALERNPMVQAALAAADATAARQPAAALPPDPEVRVGAMNLSLPGLSADMPGAMAPSIELMQMLPLPGKLRLNGEIARQSTAMALSEAGEVSWEVRARAAMAFYEVYEADRQIEVMEETLDWLRQFEQIATTMYSVGSGTQSDVLRAGVEVARMKADITRMRTMRTSAVAKLNGLLDRPADTSVTGVVFTQLPAAVPETDELMQWAEASRPLLARQRAGIEQAQAREELARKEIWPDLSLGLQYGRRGTDMGTEHMGSLMVGFTVPVFASRRQLPMRTEASAMLRMAQAELADARAQVNARITELVANLERARTLITLYRSEVLPQAEANITSALGSYRVGRVDFMTLVDAQMSANRYAQELYALLADYGATVAELEMAIGRELPATTETIVEEA